MDHRTTSAQLRQSLNHCLAACSHIKHFHVHETLGSTNDEAMRLMEQGAPSGTLIVALKQEQGRGRLKRSWTMQEGDLACSLLLRKEHLPKSHSSLLPLVAALAVHDALSALHVHTELKWPNDIVVKSPDGEHFPYFLNYLKLGGVLVESAFAKAELAASIIGIGINIRANAELSRALPHIACVERLAPSISLAALLNTLIPTLDQAIEQLRGSFHSLLLARYERISATLGHEVKVCQGSEMRLGKAIGFNEEGALLIYDGTSTATIYAGDVISAS